MERLIVPNPVVKKLKGMVTILLNTLPVIQNMRNPALKDRHWKKMEVIIGRKVPKKTFSVLHFMRICKYVDFNFHVILFIFFMR